MNDEDCHGMNHCDRHMSTVNNKTQLIRCIGSFDIFGYCVCYSHFEITFTIHQQKQKHEIFQQKQRQNRNFLLIYVIKFENRMQIDGNVDPNILSAA